MSPRDWKANESFQVSGIDLCVTKGSKGPDDLLLWAYSAREKKWVKVTMDLSFFLADFFAFNEDTRARNEPFWKFSGAGYFLLAMKEATVIGWRASYQKLMQQRRRRGAA